MALPTKYYVGSTAATKAYLGSTKFYDAAPAVTYRSAVLADSPRAYFPLDTGSAVDVMGNVTPSSVAGVTFGVAGIGDGATAASFDGGATARGIILPESQMQNGSNSAFTVEIIAKANDMSAQRALFYVGRTALLRHTGGSVMDAFTGVNTWAVRTGSAGYTESAATARHHWAMTYTGSSVNLYRDGVNIITGAASGPSDGSPTPTHIGSRDGTDLTFFGTLAGFAWYKTALSPSRILAHAQAAGVA